MIHFLLLLNNRFVSVGRSVESQQTDSGRLEGEEEARDPVLTAGPSGPLRWRVRRWGCAGDCVSAADVVYWNEFDTCDICSLCPNKRSDEHLKVQFHVFLLVSSGARCGGGGKKRLLRLEFRQTRFPPETRLHFHLTHNIWDLLLQVLSQKRNFHLHSMFFPTHWDAKGPEEDVALDVSSKAAV